MRNEIKTVQTNKHTLWCEFSSWPFEGETVEEEICDLVWSLTLEPRPRPETEPLPRPCFFLFKSELTLDSTFSTTICLPSTTAWVFFPWPLVCSPFSFKKWEMKWKLLYIYICVCVCVSIFFQEMKWKLLYMCVCVHARMCFYNCKISACR